jgi:hypothetical protein
LSSFILNGQSNADIERGSGSIFQGEDNVIRRKSRFGASFWTIQATSLAVTISSSARGDVSATWNGSTNNWSDAAAWSTNPYYPNNGTPLGLDYDVTISSGNITLDVNPTIQTLKFSGGVLSISNTLTIDGLFTWTGGSIGVNQVNADGGFALQGSVLAFSVGTITNPSGEISTIGSMGSSCSLYLADEGTLDNAGTLNVVDGDIFDAGGDVARTIENSGSLNANDAGGTVQIGGGLTFVNTGTVNAQAGELLLATTNTESIAGTFNVSSGATLAFGGTLTLGSSASLSGDGALAFTAGMVTINTSSINVSGAIDMTGGSAIFNANETLDATLNFSGGVLTPYTGVTLTAAHGIAFGSNTPILDIGTLTNPAGQTATFGASGEANLDLADDATFDNAGTVAATNGGIFDVGGGESRNVVNSGTFNSSDAGGTIEIGSGLTFNNSGTINIKSGTMAINAMYTGTSTGTIDVSSGATLNVGGPFAQPAGITNNGSLVFASTASTVGKISGSGSLTIDSGTAQVDVGSGASSVAQLNIVNGTLDLTNNSMLIHYGSGTDPIASVRADLLSGYNGGAWNGSGIDSSSAAANSVSYGLGYADSADAGNPAGLSSGTIEIAYTLLGDANLSGVVDGVDFGIVAANFNKGVTGWDQGDFNYDNVVDGADFADLAANFNKGASGAAIGLPAYDDLALMEFAAANGLLADVPEPAAGGLIVAAICGAMARRRRSRADSGSIARI